MDDGHRFAATHNFRRQHEELVALAIELQSRLTIAIIEADPNAIRRLVAKFAGKLTMHASMENGALYPRLLHHSDDSVRAHARALFDEVEGIYASFNEFAHRWIQDTALLESDPARFVRECRDILKKLGKRMVRENNELYPLADAHVI